MRDIAYIWLFKPHKGYPGYVAKTAMALACISFLFVGSPTARAYMFTPVSDSATLMANLLGCGVSVSATNTIAAGSALGLFDNLDSSGLCFSRGVLISTGNGAWGCAFSPTNSQHLSSIWNGGMNHGNPGDADLEAAFGLAASYDAVGLDLTVIPNFSTLNIRYFMASEHYFYNRTSTNDYTISAYNNADVFGFFVGGVHVGSMLTNIALTAEGIPVSIRNINEFQNQHLFIPNLVISNAIGSVHTPCVPPEIPFGMQYNGVVTPLVATIKVTPGIPYRLKIVLADGTRYPQLVDTAVFLEQFSLTSGADLRVDVTPVPAAISIGSAARYDVVVSNIGPIPAANVVVTNWLPVGICATNTVLPIGATMEWYDGSNRLVCALGTLTNGHSRTLSFYCPFEAVGTFTNRAVAGTSIGDYNPTNNIAEGVVQVGAGITDVSVLKNGPSTGVAGEPLTYMLIVSNAGPSLAHGIALVDTPPTGTTAQSPLSYALNDLLVGASTSLLFTVDVHADTLGWITNRAMVTTTSLDTNSINNTAEAATQIHAEADLCVSKTANVSSVHGGTPVLFMIVITNAGPSLARNVLLEDRQTGEVGGLLWSTGVTNAFDLTWPSLAPGDFLRLTVTAETRLVAGVITNRVTLLSDAVDTNSANNVAQTLVAVTSGTESIAVTAVWTLNLGTGLFDVLLTLRNDGTLPLDNRDFWLALLTTDEWRLWNPSGTLPDTKAFYNLTGEMRAGLQVTGNRDAVLDPRESVTVEGPQIYHRRRVNPKNYVNPTTAVQYGLLFSRQDRNRDFRIQADEIEQAAKAWRAGTLADDGLLEATRLHRGAAYLWEPTLGTWRILTDDARD